MNQNNLDQYYTNRNLANNLIKIYLCSFWKSNTLFVEPSAGDGSFSDFILQDGYACLAIDLDPKKDYIIVKDFLQENMQTCKDGYDYICVIGNPPFGKNSSLAVKFFNKAAEIADYICFILPKTFKKDSIHKRLNKQYHIIYEQDLPKNSFILYGKTWDVPCIFQIWEKRLEIREERQKIIECKYFDFVDKENADFAVRRVGGNAGKAFANIIDMSITSNYFLKCKNGYTIEYLIEMINGIDFKEIVNSTAGVRSLSKQEFLRKVIDYV